MTASQSSTRPSTGPLVVSAGLLVLALVGFGLVIDWGYMASLTVQQPYGSSGMEGWSILPVQAASRVIGAFLAAMCAALVALMVASRTAHLVRSGIGLILVGIGVAGFASGLAGLDGFRLTTGWNVRVLTGLAWLSVSSGAQTIAIQVIRRLGGGGSVTGTNGHTESVGGVEASYLRAPRMKRQPR